MLRYLVILGLIVIGAVIALSFYQPPMRLMPAPGSIPRRTRRMPSPPIRRWRRIPAFRFSTPPIACRSARATTGSTRWCPGRDLHIGVATIRIGEEGTTWDRIYAWSTARRRRPRPFLHLENLNEQATIESGEPLSAEAKAWFAAINAALETEPRQGHHRLCPRRQHRPSSAPPDRLRSCIISPGAIRSWCCSPGRPPRTSCAIRGTWSPPSARRRIWRN